MSLVKEVKTTSGGSKADKKRSNKHQHAPSTSPAAANIYASKQGDTSNDDYDDGDNVGNGFFITFNGKELSFDDFVEVLNDKHDRDEAVKWLYTSKLKSFNIHQPPITPAMADQLLGGIRAAMGLGAGAGRKGGKKATSDAVPSPSVAQARERAVDCGTALVLCCGHESRELFDTWGSALMTTITNIIKGIRGQMEDYVHSANTALDAVNFVVASPSGITSNASAAQRRMLSEIAGRCYSLLVKCFESLSLLHAFDPAMSVNDEHETVAAALLNLAALVIPDYGLISPNKRELSESFPLSGTPDNTFYLPVEASGSMLRCLVSCCEPAQGPKARAALLRLHRFITGTTAVQVLGDDDEEQNSAAGESQESTGAEHKTSYMGLLQTLIMDLAEAIGILGSRFTEMVAQDEGEGEASSVTSPTASQSTPFATAPLLSVDLHLMPLSELIKSKAMAKGKSRREAQALLRQAAKKLGSLNGTNIDSLEEHETRKRGRRVHRSANTTIGGSGPSQVTSPSAKLVGKFPLSDTTPPEDGELPLRNPNRADAEESAAAEEELAATAAVFDQQTFDGADPLETIQFRDKIHVSFVGFQQIFLAHCLRNVVSDGFQRQLAQNPHIKAFFHIQEDLTRKIDRGERKEQIYEAEEHKAEEKKVRQKERDTKMQAREYFNDE